MNTTALPPGPPVLHLHDGRATISLNRPAHHNRLHADDLLALQRHFGALAVDPTVKLLVLTGAGRSFCSGFHLGDFAEAVGLGADSDVAAGADAPAGSLAATRTQPLAGPQLFEQTVDALEALAVPTICRFNGPVYGGGTDLALACDFRVGVAGMVLRMPAARLGLHYYPSGLQRYVSRLGLATAKRLFLLAEEVSADQLLALGYLDRLVDAAQLDAAVQAIADALAAGAPLALRGMKASLNEIARGQFHLPTLREREARCAASADLAEGRAAFAESRRPLFTGR